VRVRPPLPAPFDLRSNLTVVAESLYLPGVVRTGAALAASASRAATVRPRRGEGVGPRSIRIVIGIAPEPRPQPAGECSDPSHGPRVLLDPAKPFIRVRRPVATLAHG
jgi:hypothetical protein